MGKEIRYPRWQMVTRYWKRSNLTRENLIFLIVMILRELAGEDSVGSKSTVQIYYSTSVVYATTAYSNGAIIINPHHLLKIQGVWANTPQGGAIKGNAALRLFSGP